jgi:Lon protease-like protein
MIRHPPTVSREGMCEWDADSVTGERPSLCSDWGCIGRI